MGVTPALLSGAPMGAAIATSGSWLKSKADLRPISKMRGTASHADMSAWPIP